MRHSRVYVLRIFKILNRCQFWPFFDSCRVFLERGKIARRKKRIGNCNPYHLALFLPILALLELNPSMLSFKNSYQVPGLAPLGYPSMFLECGKILDWKCVDWKLSPISCRLLILSILKVLEIWHSHVFVARIFKILSRCPFCLNLYLLSFSGA